MLAGLTEVHIRHAVLLLLQGFELADSALEELDFFHAADLALAPHFAEFVLDLFEEFNGAEDWPHFSLVGSLVEVQFLLQIQHSVESFLLVSDVVVELSQFSQLGENVFLLGGLGVGFVGVVDFPSLVLDADDSAGSPLLSQVAFSLLRMLSRGRPSSLLVLILGPLAVERDDDLLQLCNLQRHLLLLLVILVELRNGSLVDALEFLLGLLLVPLHLFAQLDVVLNQVLVLLELLIQLASAFLDLSFLVDQLFLQLYDPLLALRRLSDRQSLQELNILSLQLHYLQVMLLLDLFVPPFQVVLYLQQ